MSYRKVFGDFMKGVVNKTAMTESSGTLGGYTVPEEVAVSIDAILQEQEFMWANCWVQPMKSRKITVPAVDLAATHATGESPLYGGMALNWTSEGATITESEPLFSAAELVAYTLTATCYASNQLVDDGGEPLGKFLETLFAYIIGWTTTREFLQGSGVGRPLGIVNAPATKLVTRNAGSDVKQVDLAGMAAGLLPASFCRAIWACNPSTLVKICSLSGYHVNPGTILPCLVGEIFGRPLYVTEALPALGTTGDVILFDPRMYVIGKRDLLVEATREEQTAFYKNQTIFRLTWRGNGQPLPRNTCTLADGSTTAGAFVALN